MKVKNAVPVVIKIKINTELTEPFNLLIIKAFNAISLLEKKNFSHDERTCQKRPANILSHCSKLQDVIA